MTGGGSEIKPDSSGHGREAHLGPVMTNKGMVTAPHRYEIGVPNRTNFKNMAKANDLR